jgi:hypothetical protein
LRTPPDREGFRRHLEAASREPLLCHDKLLRELADIVSLDFSETQPIHTARLLESHSLLADVMVRTRKREAFPSRVVRKPWVLQVKLSPQEQQLYQNLSARIRSVARRENPGTPGEFKSCFGKTLERKPAPSLGGNPQCQRSSFFTSSAAGV